MPGDDILRLIRDQMRRAAAIARADCADAIAAAREDGKAMAESLAETETQLEKVTAERDALRAQLAALQAQRETVDA